MLGGPWRLKPGLQENTAVVLSPGIVTEPLLGAGGGSHTAIQGFYVITTSNLLDCIIKFHIFSHLLTLNVKLQTNFYKKKSQALRKSPLSEKVVYEYFDT